MKVLIQLSKYPHSSSSIYFLSLSVYTEEIRPTLYYPNEQANTVFFWMHFALHMAVNVRHFAVVKMS